MYPSAPADDACTDETLSARRRPPQIPVTGRLGRRLQSSTGARILDVSALR
jgi:hypothetical protein